jgi:hypothetical protein
LGISFHFRLESLCRKTQSLGARVLLMAANCVVSAVSNGSVRFFAGHVCYCSERTDDRNWKWHALMGRPKSEVVSGKLLHGSF